MSPSNLAAVAVVVGLLALVVLIGPGPFFCGWFGHAIFIPRLLACP